MRFSQYEIMCRYGTLTVCSCFHKLNCCRELCCCCDDESGENAKKDRGCLKYFRCPTGLKAVKLKPIRFMKAVILCPRPDSRDNVDKRMSTEDIITNVQRMNILIPLIDTTVELIYFRQSDVLNTIEDAINSFFIGSWY
eukprot:UN22894